MRSRLVAVGLLVALLAACGDEKQDVFSPEGRVADDVNKLQVPIFIIAGVVGVLVLGLVWWATRRGMRQHRNDTDDPVQLEGNFKLEIGWTIAPAVLLALICVPTVATLFSIDDADGAEELNGLEITVYGQQWWWSYEYDLDPDEDDGPEIITANDLVIPAGIPISLAIESRDVIHSFWIPALAGTRDAVPGRTHSLVLEADEPGEFDGQCKEFCGLSHGNMKARVVALSMSEFETWLDQQQQEQALLEEGDDGYDGQVAFQSLCASCHQINGVNEVEGDAALVAGHAPNLTHLMSREVFAGALFDLYDPDTGTFNRPELEAWLRDPPGEKPMSPGDRRGMPNLELSEDQIDDLVEYLTTLGPRPPSPSGPEIPEADD
jgi:cytochrome c oxidase subunit 2